VALQEGGGDLAVHLALDGAADDGRLVLAGREDGDLAAARIVATPIVTASRGTLSSPKKSAEASRRVTASRWTTRVRLSSPDPGSLKPMCPVLPMPRSWKSMPPARSIACS
jgi:hypothetical protein